MFAYLILLHEPSPHPLLCVEEPENQLYPHLLCHELESWFLGDLAAIDKVFGTFRYNKCGDDGKEMQALGMYSVVSTLLLKKQRQ
ncbi:hypothetical protein PN36_13210 [Candidatus Thiomargarita nelsonii]|uniref:Uncharacterized protein n=1 Tax=Candidatus Thiomargarita nelsonii TaxID=1003181 RepID=A0A0A6PBY6_9GAMM|nr:hypothetical protein PN36_13150 [Candidatus Thiomargarita nelsonii]TGO03083.1 hypothetical protein PN36_13210 [Candidatus Thiomargarita nelsonii]